jgi:Ca-activated chloride channel family protein
MLNRKQFALIALGFCILLLTACSAAGETEESDYIAPPMPTTVPDYGPTYGGLDPVNGQPYHDVFFENYGVNPFIDTEDDSLSTFALDVDTGSYTVARRYLNDGNLPPKDAIRVEEFVNFFDMEYKPPDEEAFAIYLDGGLTPFVQNDRYRILRIGIQGYDVPDEERKPAMLTFIIDVSGSMDYENRLGSVKYALNSLVDSLRPTDQVGIVVYGSRARVVLHPTPLLESETIHNAINSLITEGATNAEEGIRLGYQIADKAFSPGMINRVILCSDGVANVGQTGPDAILESIREYARQGIQLTTVGFGMGNYNDVLMERLADDGDGFYAYVDTNKEAERLFVDDLTGTLQTIAMDAKVQAVFNPEVVTRFRLIGFENRALEDDEFRDDTVDAGEIGAGHSVTALYEVKLAQQAIGEIAMFHLRWKDPDDHEVHEISRSIATSDLAQSFEQTPPPFRLAVMVAEYAEILRESYWAKQYTLGDLAAELDWVQGSAFENEDVIEFVDLVQRASNLACENGN